ncbi:sporulation protein [Bacillus aerolatus]|uniref:Sporulation protein n=1 Tax=Bacillus aerolatus TaxID=2653354 RepID=A0A6I1FMJ3_9BACI|nr:stage VI sporulation protein F [Bacillus aerolatus]KAB7705016.1 sporulation protein [Bacillus aerolatus]
MDNGFFKNIEQKTGVRMKDVLELANSLQNANFKDQQTVRDVIKRVAALANKPVPQQLEDQIVQSIVKDGSKLDIQTITDMLNKKDKG